MNFAPRYTPACTPNLSYWRCAQSLRAVGLQHYLAGVSPTGCGDDRLNAAPTAGFPSADLADRVSDLFESFSLRRA